MAYSTATDARREVCATCQYWQGDREIKFGCCAPNRVRHHGSSAPCSAWKQSRGAGFRCNRYKRWVELP